MSTVVVATCGTVAVAAGCGGSASAAPCAPTGPTGPSVTAVAAGAPRHLSVVGAAAAKTQEAGSARFAMRTSGGTTAVPITMTGVSDFVHQRAQMQFSGGANGTDFTAQMRLVGHCEYMEAVPLDLPTKKSWASIDINRVFPGLTGGSSATAANDSLRELEQAGSFHRVGVRRVRGVATTLYSGTIAASTVSAKLPKRYGEALAKEHVTSIPTRAWVDRSGYLRRLTESVGGVLVTVEYYDFGVPVHVKAPPLDQVQDLTSKIKSELGA